MGGCCNGPRLGSPRSSSRFPGAHRWRAAGAARRAPRCRCCCPGPSCCWFRRPPLAPAGGSRGNRKSSLTWAAVRRRKIGKMRPYRENLIGGLCRVSEIFLTHFNKTSVRGKYVRNLSCEGQIGYFSPPESQCLFSKATSSPRWVRGTRLGAPQWPSLAVSMGEGERGGRRHQRCFGLHLISCVACAHGDSYG